MTPMEILHARLADPQLRPLTALTSRTQTILGDRCPRARWWEYEYQGLGVTQQRTPLYFIFGSAIHEGLTGPKGMLSVMRDHDRPPTRDEARLAIDLAVALFQQRCEAERPRDMEFTFEDQGKMDLEMSEFTYEGEQAALLEGLLWAWFWRRAERFSEAYRVLEVEKEDAVLLGAYNRIVSAGPTTEVSPGAHVSGIGSISPVEVWFQARADALLEERTTSGLYVMSVKSAGDWEARKSHAGNTDMQGVSEAYCIEQRLGRKILGVQMEYLIKGKRDKKQGYWQTYSPVIRGWVDKAGTPGAEQKRYWRYEWVEGGSSIAGFDGMVEEFGRKRRLGGKQRPYHPWFSTEMGVERWVEALHRGEVQPEAGDALAEVCIAPEYYRDDRQMRGWFVATAAREVERKRLAEELQQAGEYADVEAFAGAHQDQLDRAFPQFTHSCNYPTRCPYLETLCFGTTSESEIDPLAFQDESGAGQSFKWREPHHEPERRLVQIEGGVE